jgi:hypothetical protein
MRWKPYVCLAHSLATGVRRSLVLITDTLESSLGGLLAEGAVGDICHEALA